MDTTIDEAVPNGTLSLREAIEAANTDTAFGDAPAGSRQGDVIVFDAAVAGQIITLGGTELTITDDLWIRGGAGITVDGAGASRVFRVNTDSRVILSGVNVKSGYAAGGSGGGIVAEQGELHLRRLSLYSNVADVEGGALLVDAATVRMHNSYLVGNFGGGALVNAAGTLELYASGVDGNQSQTWGGGIRSLGQLTVLQSYLSGNIAAGGMGRGGGVWIEGGSAHFRRSLFDGNYASDGGAVGMAAGTLGMRHCLLQNNFAGLLGSGAGAGLYIDGPTTVNLHRTTFAGNFLTGVAGAIYNNVSGTVAATYCYFSGNSSGYHGGPSIGGDGAGGAIYNRGAMTLSGATFVDNDIVLQNLSDTSWGGAIFNDGTLIVDRSYVLSNTAESGGGIYNETNGVTTILASTIRDNIPDNLAGPGVVN